MIKNEAEIRIALQAVLASVLAFDGYWGCAFVVLVIMLPWRPILAAAGYLVQPIVDWRIQKARDRHGKGIAQIERELDALLRVSKGARRAPAPAPATRTAARSKPSRPPLPQPLESFKPKLAAGPAFPEMAGTAQNLSVTLAIPPAIKDHVRSLPPGIFSNMELEVEEVRFNGDTAEAEVRFQSPNVTELIIRQRYVLRKCGDQWQVESANGERKVPPHSLPAGRASMRLT